MALSEDTMLKHLVEVSQDVANFILESEEDVWENIPVKYLVKTYFENTKKTLEIFNNIMKCVDKAELGQHVLLEAVAQFDKESAEKALCGKKKKYEKTLKELKKFKAMKDPFAGSELKTQFQLIKEQQESLLKEVSEAKQKIDEEVEKSAKEIDAEEHKKKGIMARWVGVDKLDALKNRIDALKKQQEALKKLNDQLESVEKGTEKEMQFDKEALESELVEGVEENILDILNHLDNEGDEVDTKLALHSMDKVKKIIEKTKEVGKSVDKYSKLIREARFHVLEKINGSGKYQHVEDAKHQTEAEYQTGKI